MQCGVEAFTAAAKGTSSTTTLASAALVPSPDHEPKATGTRRGRRERAVACPSKPLVYRVEPKGRRCGDPRRQPVAGATSSTAKGFRASFAADMLGVLRARYLRCPSSLTYLGHRVDSPLLPAALVR